MPLKGWGSLAAALVAACFTLQDIKNAECRVGCMSAGYDSGWFESGACYCAEKKSYERFKEKRLILPKRPAKPARPFFPFEKPLLFE